MPADAVAGRRGSRAPMVAQDARMVLNSPPVTTMIASGPLRS